MLLHLTDQVPRELRPGGEPFKEEGENVCGHELWGKEVVWGIFRKVYKMTLSLSVFSLIRLLNVLNIGYSSIFFVVFLDPFCFVFVFL